MLQDYLKKILTAHVYDVAEETPLDYASILSARFNNDVWLKREDEQAVFSFKCRGAYNKMSQLSRVQLKKGVIAASAGNHAQGVALSGQVLSTRTTIVMPRTTPSIKVDAVSMRGAEVVLHGDNYDDAYSKVRELAAKHKLTFVHPFDDPLTIAGQGTIGFELLKQHVDNVHAIFVPVGGGGLIAGIGAYVKQVRPEIKVIGVECDDSDSMYQSLKAGRRLRLKEVGIFADGTAVRQVGKETFRIARKCVDDMIRVSSDEICAAIKDVFEDTRSIMEPSGALSVAGVKAYLGQRKLKNKSVIAITSGANMNFDRLRHVSERAEIGERREAILTVTIPERPGSFRQFCSIIGDRNITEFNYRYADPDQAHVFVGMQISSGKEVQALIKELRSRSYPTVDLTDNEMAKLHVRHLVGGHAPTADNERIYRFEFPERPGALMNFLDRMGQTWNISLFHYRSHGAEVGRVLCGLQVPPEDKRRFRAFLKEIGYAWCDETDNPACRLFLG
ncbi:MAG: L-threonine dehydratase biosynthetic IlvA [Gammaproteobacteria bacterium]|nr:L-threonine dehydratase biosynthetic IlvA [Gammaproteobacteria bacterium]